MLKGIFGGSGNGLAAGRMDIGNWKKFAEQGGTVDDAGQLVDAGGNAVGQMDWNDYTGSWDTGFKAPTQMGGFLGGVDALAKLGNVGVGLANYGLAKDAYKFNVMNANRNYEADKTKYNNALARTEAVNAVYGSPNVATKL